MVGIEKVLGCGALPLWSFMGIIYPNGKEIKNQKKSYFWGENFEYDPVTELFSLDVEEKNKSASSKIVGRIIEEHPSKRHFYGIQIYGKDPLNECDKTLALMEVSGEIFFDEQRKKLILNGTSLDSEKNGFVWNLESRSIQEHL